MEAWMRLAVVAVAAVLAACGGGTKAGGGAGTPGQPGSVSIALAILDGQSSQVTTSLTEGREVVVRATVTNGRNPVVNEIVGFELGEGSFTTFVPANRQSLTDSQGVATLRFVPSANAGAYSLRATVREASATLNYAITSAFQPVASIRILDGNGTSLTLLRPGEAVNVQFSLVSAGTGSASGQQTPIPNTLVTFASDGGTFSPARGEALTNADGLARIPFLPNVAEGPFTVSATAKVGGRDVSASVRYVIDVPDIVLGGGTPFTPGAVELELAEIPGGGSTNVRVRLVDQTTGRAFAPVVPVIFTSNCVAAEQATITSPVLSVDGVATTVFRAGGACVGTDLIRARVVIPGLAFAREASAQIRIQPPQASGVEFVSATPPRIALQGRASATAPDTSEVKFRVKSSSGAPVPGQLVAFELTSVAGGMQLVGPGAVSDANGEVIARVRSGTVAAVTRVIARVAAIGAVSQSAEITVTTGTADQDSVSVSIEELNPEALNIDGVENNVTIRLADLFNNPIPDGQQVVWTTEGGAIDATCVSSGGACSVTWRSQNPRPDDGRVTILARTVGDESFTDTNGNGIFDGNDVFNDLPEAFRDDNENGQRDPAEPFSDLNNNGVYDGPNGVYDGALCAHPTLCGRSRAVEVRGRIVLTMSSSRQNITIFPSTINLAPPNRSQRVQVYVSDERGNLPPVGTKIEVSASNGQLSGPGSFEVGNTNARGPLVLEYQISADATTSQGLLTVKATAPGGTETLTQAVIAD